jgi:rubrerythrin
MLKSDLTSIESLGLAVAQEIAAYKRYRLFAARVSNPLVKEKFNSLAREENSHRELLYNMLRRFTGEDKPPLPKKAPRINREAEANQPLHLILQLAIQKEQEAQQFYREAAGCAMDPTGRQIFEYLAEFERGHERALQAEFDAVAKYPQWFEIGGADIMLVGP